MKLAVFASGFGSNFSALLEAEKQKKLSAEIALLICDQPKAKVIERAVNESIPYYCLSPKDFPCKAHFEKQLVQILEKHEIDLIVLAGYMRLIGSTLLEPYRNRIINIHPSLLPSFPGRTSIADAYYANVTESGVTIHYIDEGIDTGPIIYQEVVAKKPDDTLETFESRIHSVEHAIYPTVLEKIIQEGETNEKTSVN